MMRGRDALTRALALATAITVVAGCTGAANPARAPIVDHTGHVGGRAMMPLCAETAPDKPEELWPARGGDMPVRHVAPALAEYPRELQEVGLEGEVLLEFVVNSAGCAVPSTIRPLRPAHPLFLQAARLAVRRSRYGPAQQGGRIVSMRTEQAFVFKLE